MRTALMLLALLFAATSWARPAVVRVFEAKLHEKAEASSPVLGLLVEGQRLSVSESAESGWRRVRLADGRTAWVRDEALFLDAQLPKGAAPAGTPALTAGAPTAAPPGSAPVMQLPTPGAAVALPAGSGPPDTPAIWVDDLAGLRTAVAKEPGLVTEVDRLTAMDRNSQWVFWGGLSGGVLMAAVPTIIAVAQDERPASGWFYGGAGILLATQMLAWSMSVGESDLRDVARHYNKKHPDPRIAVGQAPNPEDDEATDGAR